MALRVDVDVVGLWQIRVCRSQPKYQTFLRTLLEIQVLEEQKARRLRLKSNGGPTIVLFDEL
jgi:hypothetical protein